MQKQHPDSTKHGGKQTTRTPHVLIENASVWLYPLSEASFCIANRTARRAETPTTTDKAIAPTAPTAPQPPRVRSRPLGAAIDTCSSRVPAGSLARRAAAQSGEAPCRHHAPAGCAAGKGARCCFPRSSGFSPGSA